MLFIPVKFKASFVRQVDDDLRVARLIVHRLQGQGGLPITSVDQGYRGKWLEDAEGEDVCRANLYRARVSILHLFGAIGWGLCHVNSFAQRVFLKSRAARLRAWRIIGAPRLGFVLDPTSVYFEDYPILDLLKNGCPLYYPWSEKWRSRQEDADLRALAHLTIDNFADVFDSSVVAVSPHVAVRSIASAGTDIPLIPPYLGLGDLFDRSPTERRLNNAERLQLRLKALQTELEHFWEGHFSKERPDHVQWTAQDSWKMNTDGVLIIDVSSETKLRLWLLWNRSASPADVVLEAIARGIPIKIAFPRDSDTAKRHLDDIEPRTPPLPLSPLFAFIFDLPATWELYLDQLRRLLSRPNAVVFLMLGRIYCRIALWFGPNDLLKRFIDGPSLQSALRYTSLSEDELYLSDEVDNEDLNTLIGAVDDSETGVIRSWFPTQENMEFSNFFRGEWTEAHESWFRTRIGDLYARRDKARPLTSQQWTIKLRRRAERSMPPGGPSDDGLLAMIDSVRDVCGNSWNGRAISEIGSEFKLEKDEENMDEDEEC